MVESAPLFASVLVLRPTPCLSVPKYPQLAYPQAQIGQDHFVPLIRSYQIGCILSLLLLSNCRDPQCRHCFTSRPDLAYHLVQTVFFCAVAVVVLR